MKVALGALLASKPRDEPLLNPPVPVANTFSASISAEVNSPVPPTLKAAIPPEATTILEADQVAAAPLL